MGKPPAYNPIKETEYMARYNLSDAEYDGILTFIASTFRPEDSRVVMGTGIKGPRVLDFAPILKLNEIPLNRTLKILLKLCEENLKGLVEIEFAATLDKRRGIPLRLGFLQVRPMVVSRDKVHVAPQELTGGGVLLASEKVLGNGVIEDIRDIIYIKPGRFTIEQTQNMAPEIERMNQKMVEKGRSFLLIGFGRWGTTDPAAGIPVNFGQISRARVIVESTLPGMDFTFSQGSHFFHNITSSKVFYFSIHHEGKYQIQWEWLEKQKVMKETRFIRHVVLQRPLSIKIDGQSRRGVIRYE